MADTTLATTEGKSNRDLAVAAMMLLGAVSMFWHLDSVFSVSAYFWYSLLYVAIVSPFGGLVLHARPFRLKLAFWVMLVAAVFLL